MSRIQIVVASRHGGTTGIADRIAQVLRSEGNEVVVADAARRPDPDGLRRVRRRQRRLHGQLAQGGHRVPRSAPGDARDPSRSGCSAAGPFPARPRRRDTADPLELALGPTEGPGSGGHRRIAALAAAVSARDHRVFLGAYDPSDPPKSVPERIVRLLPSASKTLPTGDFRDWDAIEAWARAVASGLAAEVPVG